MYMCIHPMSTAWVCVSIGPTEHRAPPLQPPNPPFSTATTHLSPPNLTTTRQEEEEEEDDDDRPAYRKGVKVASPGVPTSPFKDDGAKKKSSSHHSSHHPSRGQYKERR